PRRRSRGSIKSRARARRRGARVGARTDDRSHDPGDLRGSGRRAERNLSGAYKVTSTEGNAAQVAYWNDRAGIIWTEFQERLDAQFAPLTAIALNAAAPSAGECVLDIGSGCGETVLELARRVGSGGRVTGIDVSEPMSARARAR